MKLKNILAVAILAAAAAPAFALNITVAPTSGVIGTATTTTFEDAIVQINAGADAANTITARSTEGAIILPANTVWTINAGKSLSIVAESGRPIIRLSHTAGQNMLAMGAGTNANNQTETISITGVAFIPPIGLAFVNNVADGIRVTAGKFIATDVLFTTNNGTNGIGSLDGSAAFVQPGAATGNVGDDWIQFGTLNDVTLTNCLVTGANDDAVIATGATTPAISTLRINGGTAIANNGGAGLQVAGNQQAVIIDGAAGRILIAKNGLRTGAADDGIKFFNDIDTALTITKADIVDNTGGGISDLAGIHAISITDSRIALNNVGNVATSANFGVTEADTTTEDSSLVTQTITINRSTFHDSLATNNNGLFASDLATAARQNFQITNSIFSGAGDTFANATNSLATGGASPAPTVSNSAVVTAGAHAVAAGGDLGTTTLSSDPAYVSLTYTIGRSQANPDFLKPTTAAYLSAGSNGGGIGGAELPAPTAASSWNLYQ